MLHIFSRLLQPVLKKLVKSGVVASFIIVVFVMVVFVMLNCCNMDGIAPHGTIHIFGTAAHALIASSAVVQKVVPEE